MVADTGEDEGSLIVRDREAGVYGLDDGIPTTLLLAHFLRREKLIYPLDFAGSRIDIVIWHGLL